MVPTSLKLLLPACFFSGHSNHKVVRGRRRLQCDGDGAAGAQPGGSLQLLLAQIQPEDRAAARWSDGEAGRTPSAQHARVALSSSNEQAPRSLCGTASLKIAFSPNFVDVHFQGATLWQCKHNNERSIPAGFNNTIMNYIKCNRPIGCKVSTFTSMLELSFLFYSLTCLYFIEIVNSGACTSKCFFVLFIQVNGHCTLWLPTAL